MIKSLELTKPHLLVVVGLPGAGKSFFAKQFADMFGAPYVDYYHFQQLTRNAELGDVVATDLLGQLLLTKQTILIEGRGETKQDRQILAQLAKSKDYEILYVWVQTEPQTARKRVTSPKNTVYTDREFDERSATFSPLDRTEIHVVISGKHTFSSQARMVLKRLTEPRAAVKVRPTTNRPSSIQNHSGRVIIR